jgi:membrane carboxypeptidase/penicillin-binding protein
MNRGFAAVVAVPAWAGFMKAATTGEKPDWLQVPAGVEHIRRCKESGGLANEYCELAGEAVDDYVSIGREPEVCTHHGYSIVAPEIAPSSSVSSISYPIRPPQ